MANLDTAAKRRSHIGYAQPFGPSLPAPDGTIAAADRLHLLHLYIGIAADPPGGATGQPFVKRMGGVPFMGANNSVPLGRVQIW